jgi:hypothetical protein
MDDIFLVHKDFPSQWIFIRDHLLPRLLWAGLKLSFKKVFLGMREVLAVETVHGIGGRLVVKPERAEKLREWPVPQDQTGVPLPSWSTGSLMSSVPRRAAIMTTMTTLESARALRSALLQL